MFPEFCSSKATTLFSSFLRKSKNPLQIFSHEEQYDIYEYMYMYILLLIFYHLPHYRLGFIVSPYCNVLHYKIKKMAYHHLPRPEHDL